MLKQSTRPSRMLRVDLFVPSTFSRYLCGPYEVTIANTLCSQFVHLTHIVIPRPQMRCQIRLQLFILPCRQICSFCVSRLHSVPFLPSTLSNVNLTQEREEGRKIVEDYFRICHTRRKKPQVASSSCLSVLLICVGSLPFILCYSYEKVY